MYEYLFSIMSNIRIKFSPKSGWVERRTPENGGLDLFSMGIPKTTVSGTAPGVDNDSASRYSIGSRWIDTSSDNEYVCTDATEGAAVWILTTSGSGGDPGGGGGVGGGADREASYILIGNTGSLPNERALTAGTGIDFTDGGAGGAFTASIDNDVVATLSGSTFSGAVIGQAGFSGSLTHLSDGTSYLVAGSNVTISTGSNGSVTIASSGGGGGGDGADPGVAYVTVGNTGSLANERALTGGTGINFTDGGANSTITAAIDDNVVATLSGSTFSGDVVAPGFSGSLTHLSDGTSYLVAGNNIFIVSGTDGSVTISGADGADPGAAYVTIGNTGSLANERSLAAGTGLSLVDGGANSSATFSIDDNVVATISGSTFTGAVIGEAGFSGSLTNLSDGTSYLVAGENVTITTASNGSVSIAAASGGGGGAGGPVGQTIEVALSSVSQSFYSNEVSYLPLRSGETDQVEFQFVTAVSGTQNISFMYAMSAAESNDVFLQFDSLSLGLGDDPTTAPTLGSSFTLTPGNDANIHSASNNENSSLQFSADSGNIVYCRLTRSGSDANDTHTGDFRILNIRAFTS